jgi:hypothetical protein
MTKPSKATAVSVSFHPTPAEYCDFSGLKEGDVFADPAQPDFVFMLVEGGRVMRGPVSTLRKVQRSK